MAEAKENQKLLEVKDLHVSFFTPAGEVKAVGGISYDLNYGEVMGVVGESGSGKSQEAYSIMGLLQSPGKVTGGSITFVQCPRNSSIRFLSRSDTNLVADCLHLRHGRLMLDCDVDRMA